MITDRNTGECLFYDFTWFNLLKQNSKDAGIKYVLYTAEQYTANFSFYFQKV